MAYGAAGKKHGIAGAYKRRNTQGRVEGAVPYLNELASLHEFVLGWLYTPRRRPSAAVSRPLADRCLRPPSTADRGLRPPPQIAGSRSMLQLPIHELKTKKNCDGTRQILALCDHKFVIVKKRFKTGGVLQPLLSPLMTHARFP